MTGAPPISALVADVRRVLTMCGAMGLQEIQWMLRRPPGAAVSPHKLRIKRALSLLVAQGAASRCLLERGTYMWWMTNDRDAFTARTLHGVAKRFARSADGSWGEAAE